MKQVKTLEELAEIIQAQNARITELEGAINALISVLQDQGVNASAAARKTVKAEV